VRLGENCVDVACMLRHLLLVMMCSAVATVVSSVTANGDVLQNLIHHRPAAPSQSAAAAALSQLLLLLRRQTQTLRCNYSVYDTESMRASRRPINYFLRQRRCARSIANCLRQLLRLAAEQSQRKLISGAAFK